MWRSIRMGGNPVHNLYPMKTQRLIWFEAIIGVDFDEKRGAYTSWMTSAVIPVKGLTMRTIFRAQMPPEEGSVLLYEGEDQKAFAAATFEHLRQSLENCNFSSTPYEPMYLKFTGENARESNDMHGSEVDVSIIEMPTILAEKIILFDNEFTLSIGEVGEGSGPIISAGKDETNDLLLFLDIGASNCRVLDESKECIVLYACNSSQTSFVLRIAENQIVDIHIPESQEIEESVIRLKWNGEEIKSACVSYDDYCLMTASDSKPSTTSNPAASEQADVPVV